jgi:hypothetical protein
MVTGDAQAEDEFPSALGVAPGDSPSDLQPEETADSSPPQGREIRVVKPDCEGEPRIPPPREERQEYRDAPDQKGGR